MNTPIIDAISTYDELLDKAKHNNYHLTEHDYNKFNKACKYILTHTDDRDFRQDVTYRWTAVTTSNNYNLRKGPTPSDIRRSRKRY